MGNVTRDDAARGALMRAMDRAGSGSTSFNAPAILDALPPDAKTVLARYLLADDSLDAAWTAAETALPEGWRLRLSRTDNDFDVWEASAVSPAFFEGENDNDAEYQYGRSPTPAAALHALAAKLAEQKP